MFTSYLKIEDEEAKNRLMEHIDSDDDLSALNNDQRIILVSHRFAPEVTSAVLWLNEKAPNLITCVQLTPYRDENQDEKTDSLYIQANTIIPVPGAEDYMIGIGAPSIQKTGNSNDGVTHFLRGVFTRLLVELPDDLKPDRTSRWAGGSSTWRYYHLWYSRPPWDNWDASFKINLERGNETALWNATVSFSDIPKGLEGGMAGIDLREDLGAISLDEGGTKKIADTLKGLIEQITPKVSSHPWPD